MKTRFGLMRRLVSVALLIVAIPCAAAPIDSRTDTRFEVMVADVKARMLTDPKAAIVLAEKALKFAEAKESPQMRVTAQWLLGEAYSRIDQPQRAVPLLADARRAVETIAPGTKLHADILLSEGGVLTAKGDVARSLADLQKAHELFSALGETRSQAKALILIALVHAAGNDHVAALRYFGQAIDVYQADAGLSVAIYNGRGNALKDLLNFSEAEVEYGKALRIAREMKSQLLVARVLNNIANVRLAQKNLVGADRAIGEGMALTLLPEAQPFRPIFLALGAEAARQRGDLAEAERLIDMRFRGVDLSKTIPPDRDAHAAAYRIYQRRGRTADALAHLAALKRLDDQATDLARSNSAALAGARFDFANQELRIAKLKADDLQKSVAFERARAATQRTLFLSIAGATLAIIAMLAFGLFTIRRSRNALALTNAALGKALAAKTEFLATTSHEIRTPLNGILGMTQVMLADPRVDAATRDRLNVVHGAGVTMRALVDDILDVAKMETGKLTIEESRIDLRRTIIEATRMWDEQARAKNLGFAVDLRDGPEWIVGDAARLRQIVFNLLSNAVKFTPDGAVSITSSIVGDRYRITVSDTGIGIVPDKHEEIFESFRQADAGTTRQFGGTGLGLSICRSLSRAMGGDVTVASTAGNGAVFTLDLPLVAATAEAVVVPAASHGVVVVDRNPITRAMFKALLEPHGGTVTFAASAQAALEVVATVRPATILIDDTTLRTDPDPLAAICAIAEAMPGVQIALLGPDPADRIALLNAGLTRIIVKPIGKEALISALFDDERSPTALVPVAA